MCLKTNVGARADTLVRNIAHGIVEIADGSFLTRR